MRRNVASAYVKTNLYNIKKISMIRHTNPCEKIGASCKHLFLHLSRKSFGPAKAAPVGFNIQHITHTYIISHKESQ